MVFRMDKHEIGYIIKGNVNMFIWFVSIEENN